MEETFASEYALLSRVTKRIARRMTTAGATVDIEDLAQEGLVAAWKALEAGKGRAYAITAAKGAMVDFLRATGPLQRNGASRAFATDPEDFRSMDFMAPTGDLDAIEESDYARWILSRLQGRQREVIERTVLGGEFLHELAAEWGVAESRVCQIRNTAIKRLRLVLGVQGVSTRGIGNMQARPHGSAVVSLADFRGVA